MPHLMAQVRIPRDSGTPEDVSVNTFHFSWDNIAQPLPAVAAGEILGRLSVFYLDVDQYLSAHNANPVEVRVYNMSDPPPRAPILTAPMVPLTFSTGVYPGEVAAVLSFQGVQISGAPQARRRGRIYLGPLSTDTGDDASPDVRPNATFRAGLAAAGENLADSSTADLTWAVYSPTDDALVGITNGWVDNAFDTIRSRGARATTRTTWSVV